MIRWLESTLSIGPHFALCLILLSGCATPCQILLNADRELNVALFDGDKNKTITTEQFAEKNRTGACFALNFIMLPYDLVCAEEILNHCEYWREYERTTSRSK